MNMTPGGDRPPAGVERQAPPAGGPKEIDISWPVPDLAALKHPRPARRSVLWHPVVRWSVRLVALALGVGFWWLATLGFFAVFIR